MNYTALSLAQSPPLAVPLRFILSTPLFLAAAALLLLGWGPEVLASRWNAPSLAFVHLITLGVLAMGMLGAMQQLLPVLMGVSLPWANGLSRAIHLGLSAGVVLQALGWLAGEAWALYAALLCLSIAFGLFMPSVLWALWRSASAHATRRAMLLALAALLLTVGLGLYLLAGHTPSGPNLAREWTDLHASLGLIGWVALLIIGVAYQVVPMFQITPEYPRALTRLLAPLLALSLLLTFEPLAAVLLVVFALITLRLQAQRRRRLRDVTLDFWRLAMAALLAAVAAWGLRRLGVEVPEMLPALLFILGFALSAMNGMLYKVVSFLIWLHLNNQLQQRGVGQARVPNMKQIIAVAPMRRQFWLQLLALLLLCAALFFAPLIYPAAILLLLSALQLGVNLYAAQGLYRRHLREAE